MTALRARTAGITTKLPSNTERTPEQHPYISRPVCPSCAAARFSLSRNHFECRRHFATPPSTHPARRLPEPSSPEGSTAGGGCERTSAFSFFARGERRRILHNVFLEFLLRPSRIRKNFGVRRNHDQAGHVPRPHVRQRLSDPFRTGFPGNALQVSCWGKTRSGCCLPS